MNNYIIDAVCTNMDNNGEGIIKLNGASIAVPYLIEGEKAKVSIRDTRGKKNARIDGLEKQSPYRVQPPCPYYYQCGGCQLQHMTADGQAWFKQRLVEKLLGKYGIVKKICSMSNPYYYRNKVHSTLSIDTKGNIISGIYEENTHNVIAVNRCLIQNEKADNIIITIREIMKKLKIKPYDEDKRQGFMRHILIKTGFATGQIMVVLVTASHVFQSSRNFMAMLLKSHPEITTVVMNINARNTSVVLGNQEKVLYGKGYIEDILCGRIFQISPKSFYQINPQQTEVLYTKAIEMAGFKGDETILDAYCGIGTIGLIASSKVKSVYGVELNKDAVRDAVRNAKRNKITNAYFYNDDAGRFMDNMARQGESVDAVFMDPPRSGSDERFLSSLAKLKPPKIIYVSCNPVTLKRDLEYMIHKGYKVKEIQPVDMFPQTCHVETVVLLSQQKPDDVIEVNLDLDELDITSAESKATYQEIKDYVLKETGLKVSSLYISQIKRKCVLKVGENYNLAKKENARVPQCPQDKEKAIRAALKHFAMI